MSIHSVSIIPFIKNKGFVICEEMRKKFPDILEKELKKHFIGGKVEYKESPLYAVSRELCEEVPFDCNPVDIELLIRNSKYSYCDIIVSDSKKLKHRFYIIYVNSIKNKKIKKMFMNMVNDFDREKSQLESLLYWDGITKLDNISSLFEKYIDDCIFIKK